RTKKIHPAQLSSSPKKNDKKSLFSKLIFFDNLLIPLFPSHWFFLTYLIFPTKLRDSSINWTWINSIFSNLSSSFTNL
ncbi:unnamed protein product, partial [Arabidopsis halleri]